MTNAEYIAGYVLAHRIYRAIRLDDHAANAVVRTAMAELVDEMPLYVYMLACDVYNTLALEDYTNHTPFERSIPLEIVRKPHPDDWEAIEDSVYPGTGASK